MQNDVFGSNPAREFAINIDQHGLGSILLQGLSGQDMLDFRGADTESQSPKSPVGGGVRITANNTHSRQGQALFRANDMHNTLAFIRKVIQFNAEIFTVLRQCFHLQPGSRLHLSNVFSFGGDIMIDGSKGVFCRMNLTFVFP